MSQYIHTAAVSTFTSTGTSTGGQAVGTWADGSSFNCRIYAATGKETYPDAQMVLAEYVMVFPLGITLTEANRVASSAITGIASFEVTFVKPVNGAFKASHQMAYLRGIK